MKTWRVEIFVCVSKFPTFFVVVCRLLGLFFLVLLNYKSLWVYYAVNSLLVCWQRCIRGAFNSCFYAGARWPLSDTAGKSGFVSGWFLLVSSQLCISRHVTRFGFRVSDPYIALARKSHCADIANPK